MWLSAIGTASAPSNERSGSPEAEARPRLSLDEGFLQKVRPISANISLMCLYLK